MMVLASTLAAAAACLSTTVAPDGNAPRPPAGAPVVAASAVLPDTTYRRLFEGGSSMDAFLAAARQRKEQWAANYARGAAIPDAVLTRARSAAGPWKFLLVAVDGCSDSVNTVPYIARLSEQVMGIELRIIDSRAGHAVMDSHRTPDGRSATPTLILLDANYQERGCWIERPSELRDWILDNKGKRRESEIFERKMQWYEDDRGTTTLLDVAAMLEAAARGEVKC